MGFNRINHPLYNEQEVGLIIRPYGERKDRDPKHAWHELEITPALMQKWSLARFDWQI